ncbi:MAG: 3-deoxy-7-phosphoheptulonate synthase [Candidatus Tectomicrobia bacterium]|nr:3-deoxy-7-phosphoheptulonate synthase [Candidatus Tectomicrobia bacterium]
MIIVMSPRATAAQLQHVIERIEALGYHAHVIHGSERNVVGAVGDERGKFQLQSLESLPGVDSVVPILKPYKLASKEVKAEKSIITVGHVKIGGPRLVVMAGPCSVESREQVMETAEVVKRAGAQILRGGAYKPRTSPYSFQGMEEEGLKLLAEAREATGLPIITEVMNPREIEIIERYTDIIQIGARNVQNFSLLKEVGQCRKPIFLKRGMSTTISEFLLSAEYILSQGNRDVILCERGIRTFETATRNTLDLSAIPVLQGETHLPVVVDPSHATGHWRLVPPMAKAAVAAGADGLMIEVHPHPEEALSDGPQALKPERFIHLMEELRRFAEVAGRTL